MIIVSPVIAETAPNKTDRRHIGIAGLNALLDVRQDGLEIVDRLKVSLDPNRFGEGCELFDGYTAFLVGGSESGGGPPLSAAAFEEARAL